MTIDLTRQELEAARAKLASEGIVLTGDSGTLNHSGVEIEVSYVEPTLNYEIVKKPGLISEGYVEKKINEWFKS